MQEIIGQGLNSKSSTEILLQLKAILPSGESVIALYSASKLKPLLMAIAITDSRLITIGTQDFSGVYKIVDEFTGDAIKSSSAEKIRFDKRSKLFITNENNESVRIADIKNDDVDSILELLGKVDGNPDRLSIYVKPKPEPVTKQPVIYNAPPEDKWQKLVTGTVNKASLEEVKKQCRGDEMPEFIAGEWGGGVLVAFQDRCVIIKKGIGTSLLASSLGGGRVSTFDYSSITGIEYNSGILQGVLEILTPSYHGHASNSVWAKRGASNNAFEQSNTLPWTRTFYDQVRDQIDWIKQRIGEAKKSSVVSNGVGDELTKLSELHKQGILTDEEFTHAKQKLLGKI